MTPIKRVLADRLHALRASRQGEPGVAGTVVASTDDIRYAQELRRRLRERYLNRAPRSIPFWCLGAD